MDFFDKLENKKWIVMGVIALFISLAFVFSFVFKSNDLIVEEKSYVTATTENTTKETNNSMTNDEEMYVDIKGAVVKPGIYKVNSTMRVLNVVELAGGFIKEADDKQINLSERVSDQMVIYIPVEGETIEEVAIANQTQKNDNQHSNGEETINLNTASIDDLKKLNGVGDRKAENIIRYREEKGSFKAIEDLKEVDGIGEKTFENLKPYISV